VKFDLPDDNDSYIDLIKAKEWRTNKPLEYSKIELEFFKNHPWYHQAQYCYIIFDTIFDQVVPITSLIFSCWKFINNTP
jgi:hypothetical protein